MEERGEGLRRTVEVCVVAGYEFCEGGRGEVAGDASGRFNESYASRMRAVESEKTYLALNLSHLIVTGASTLTSKKNGRLRNTSSTSSSHTSVVTQCSLHLAVT